MASFLRSNSDAPPIAEAKPPRPSSRARHAHQNQSSVQKPKANEEVGTFLRGTPAEIQALKAEWAARPIQKLGLQPASATEQGVSLSGSEANETTESHLNHDLQGQRPAPQTQSSVQKPKANEEVGTFLRGTPAEIQALRAEWAAHQQLGLQPASATEQGVSLAGSRTNETSRSSLKRDVQGQRHAHQEVGTFLRGTPAMLRALHVESTVHPTSELGVHPAGANERSVTLPETNVKEFVEKYLKSDIPPIARKALLKPGM